LRLSRRNSNRNTNRRRRRRNRNKCSTNIHHRLQCTSSKDRQYTPNLHKLACNSHPLLLLLNNNNPPRRSSIKPPSKRC
jgi:hypothetical protein